MTRHKIALAATLILLPACSATSAQHAGEGALVGGAAGAVGGMFSAAIFGGDVGQAAARGAAWGAGTGLVHGAVKGAKVEAKEKQKQATDERKKLDAELAKIKQQIGDDAFSGLEALAKGKHEVALAYARTAVLLPKPEHSLAGRWLEVLTDDDRGNTQEVARLLPSVVEADPKVKDLVAARRKLAELHDGLHRIRKTYGLDKR